MISATHCFNYVQCPHRAYLDEHGDDDKKEAPNAFVKMLWEDGVAHKAKIADRLGIAARLGDLSLNEREEATRAAMAQRTPLIFQGRLSVGDRVAEPDFLELHPGGYRAGDIKSGGGFSDEARGTLKKSYAIRLAHSTSILDEMGLSDNSGQAFIYDAQMQRVPYNLTAPQGVRTVESWMSAYGVVLEAVRRIVSGSTRTLPALSASCKQCVWKTACRQSAIEADDLSLIAELGRAKRDVMHGLVPTVAALATADLDYFALGKKTVFPGIGQNTLKKFQERAILLTKPKAEPYLLAPVDLPVTPKEVYFDLETDPTRGGYTYLHGFVERRYGLPQTARFVPVITPEVSVEAEELAFRQAWHYLNERLVDSVIYYYAPFELSTYKALALRFPSVCSVDDVEELFAHPNVIDLYTDVIRKNTVWPLYDLSIKTIASYLGFSWADSNPSGAASIQWFDDWVESNDPAILQRILRYNRDDCIATGVVVDGVRQLALKSAA